MSSLRRVRRFFLASSSAGCFLTVFFQQTVTHPTGPFLYPYYVPPALWTAVLLPALLVALWERNRTYQALPALALFFLWGFLMEPALNLRHQPGAVQLRIVSANLQSWSTDLDQLAGRLLTLDADILILQEVWAPEHLVFMQSALPGYTVRGDSTYEGGTAVASRLPQLECPEVPPESSAANVILLADRPVLLVSLHGRKEHTLSPHDLDKTLHRQSDQAEEMLEFIRKVGHPVIVGGDFNAPSYSPLTQAFAGQFRDAFKDAGRGYGYTFPANFPVTRLDRIYFSSELGSATKCRAVQIGSDHRAVIAELSLAPSFQSKPSNEELLFSVHGDSG